MLLRVIVISQNSTPGLKWAQAYFSENLSQAYFREGPVPVPNGHFYYDEIPGGRFHNDDEAFSKINQLLDELK